MLLLIKTIIKSTQEARTVPEKIKIAVNRRFPGVFTHLMCLMERFRSTVYLSFIYFIGTINL